ncbi:DnaJ-domain-containing protein [Trematosphaeria pertusa]|uniref:DnaJ-domain-containing protein n=1 Tax=Trematosphaeria pertusa TaxID=390896 RepID=A0A6A6J0L9_9PLEO|nr:DnaJ-domain-containing protein [Trematosphaeria pertusa]KAF2256166.1 DnaJ-domain-containing protein [Trematosphaeria pertusa]
MPKATTTPKKTHYEILNLPRIATLEQIKRAYRKVQLQSHPDKTGDLPQSKRKELEAISKAANAAYEVLSDAGARRKYDKSLGFTTSSHPYGHKPSSKSTSPSTPPPPPPAPPSSPPPRPAPAPPKHTAYPNCLTEATYRYMYTSTGTVIDIAISDWRLHLNLSSKFRFLNDVTERFSPASDTDTVSFEIGLQRDLESPEAHSPTINELTVKIHSIPSARHRISALQTLFRECAASSSLTTTTLTVRITAEPCQAGEAIFPWEFGFDFDMSTLVVARNRGTCLMFSREEPPAYMETYLGPDSPNYELMKDKRLKADGFAELFAERLLRMRYGEVEMWRCAAVGYRRER